MTVKKNILILLLFAFNLALAQEKDEFSYKFKGLIFGDLYYVQNHHLPEANNIGGAVMRRAYFTFDTKFASNWYTRLRFEANQSGEYQNYNSEVDLKDFFIGYRTEKIKIVAGLSPTKTFDIIEEFWGLRYLARTPMDMQGSPSREWGLAVDGVISSKLGLKYRTMLSHDVDLGGETGDGVRIQGALSWQPDNIWTVDVFTDYEQVERESNRNTYQIFVGYEKEKFRWAAQYSFQDRQKDTGLELFSAFIGVLCVLLLPKRMEHLSRVVALVASIVGAVVILGIVNDIPVAGNTPFEIASTAGRPSIDVVMNSFRCGARVRPVFVDVSLIARIV